MENANRVDPGADRIHRQEERAHDDVDCVANEDHAAASAGVHGATDRRPSQDRRRAGDPEDEPDLYVAGPELVEEARQVQEEVEGDALGEARDRAENEGPIQQAFVGHRAARPSWQA